MKFFTSFLLINILLSPLSALRHSAKPSRQLMGMQSSAHSLRGMRGGASNIANSKSNRVEQPQQSSEDVEIPIISGAGSEQQDGDICAISITTAFIFPAALQDFSNGGDFLPPIRTECTTAPTSMTFRFSGSSCDASATVQSDVCIDHKDAPPLLAGAQSYIIVRDVSTQAGVIFDGTIVIGDSFSLKAEAGDVLPPNLKVDIYSSSSPQDVSRVQTLKFDSSCDERTTFLQDAYGGLSLIAYESSEQSESVFIVAETEITISNLLDDSPVTIEAAAAIRQAGRVDLHIPGENIILGGDSMVMSGEPIEMDLSQLGRYTSLTTVQGSSPSDYVCRASATSEFMTGSM